MIVRYQHRQRGTFLLVALFIGAMAAASAAYVDTTPTRWLSVMLAFGLIILAWLFSCLTVVVGDNELRWYFGPGAWNYRLARVEIEAVRTVRNSWSSGFGIRMRPGFRLYNVSGLEAVELRLKTGEIRRIGTDDAPGLSAALRAE